MSGTDWLVLLGAVSAIAAVNWWFFVAGRARSSSGGRTRRDESTS